MRLIISKYIQEQLNCSKSFSASKATEFITDPKTAHHVTRKGRAMIVHTPQGVCDLDDFISEIEYNRNEGRFHVTGENVNNEEKPKDFWDFAKPATAKEETEIKWNPTETEAKRVLREAVEALRDLGYDVDCCISMEEDL